MSRTNALRDEDRRFRIQPLRDHELPPPPSFPSNFRRPRAGTLPSDVRLAASQLEQPAPPAPPPPRPSLRHAASVASSVPATGRLRSESLTLPNLANPFGGSVFSTNWSRNASNSFSPLEEALDSVDPDDFEPTLNYLGLADSVRPHPVTVSELRNQAQAAIAGNLSANPASRTRANTVSNPYRSRAATSSSLLPSSLEDYDEEEYGQDSYEGIYGASAPLVAKGFKQGPHLAVPTAGSRPRATSLGNVEESTLRLRRPGDQFPSDSDYLSPANSYGISKNQLQQTPTRSTPTVRFPANGELLARTQQPPTPKTEGPAQVQTPSRSLWIGNLDPTMTSEALIHVFAPYGAIESLRLLPEKECGFVNFVDQNDAIRAKEDVLNRLAGHIGMPNGQAVRIGFGKADSAPIAPSKSGTVAASSSGSIHLGAGNAAASSPPAVGGSKVTSGSSSAAHGSSPGAPGTSPPDSTALQNTPTRALWIGSIPSTTTPATILSVFSPFGPIESARVLTHKNCGFVNFERLDDAVRARKALNGRDVLGSDVGAIRIGFARVPVKNGSSPEGAGADDMVTTPGGMPVSFTPAGQGFAIQGVGEMTVGQSIHALRSVKGASAVPVDQQVLGGSVENYRSNLLLSMVANGGLTAFGAGGAGPAGAAAHGGGRSPSVTEQQMVMRELSGGSPDADTEVQALSEFRPPSMYYTTIPTVPERPHNRRWDASKLRELRKRLDSGTMSTEDVDDVAADFLDGEIVDLASDWLGNTVVQKLFERCSTPPRIAMLERIAPHLAMIGIHKNGTWAAQKIIDCVSTPDEVAIVAQNLRPYTPPLLLDQFGNYVVQCCLKFGSPSNDFIFDAMVDRLWEIAQGRFGARSMRACLESPNTSVAQQRRLATAIILNSIPLATNPNGALLLTWLLDSSGFPSRFRLLAPRFTPHLSHLCTHKLASLTVLRIINQKVEPDAATSLLSALFTSPADQVLTDVLSDQVNGVSVIHKILSSTFLEPAEKEIYSEATKRVVTDLKVVATQAYRRLIEELGMSVPNYGQSPPAYGQGSLGQNPNPKAKTPTLGSSHSNLGGNQTMMGGYTTTNDPALANMMAALQLQANGGTAAQLQQPLASSVLHPNSAYMQNSHHNASANGRNRLGNTPGSFSPTSDPFNPFAARSPDLAPMSGPPGRSGGGPGPRRSGGPTTPTMLPSPIPSVTPSLAQAGNLLNFNQPQYGMPAQSIPPHLYQAYMLQMYQQSQQQNVGAYHS